MATLREFIRGNKTIAEYRERLSQSTRKVFGAISVFDDKEDNYETKLSYLSIDRNDIPSASKVYCYGVVTPIGCRLEEVEPGVYIMIQDNKKLN